MRERSLNSEDNRRSGSRYSSDNRGRQRSRSEYSSFSRSSRSRSRTRIRDRLRSIWRLGCSFGFFAALFLIFLQCLLRSFRGLLKLLWPLIWPRIQRAVVRIGGVYRDRFRKFNDRQKIYNAEQDEKKGKQNTIQAPHARQKPATRGVEITPIKEAYASRSFPLLLTALLSFAKKVCHNRSMTKSAKFCEDLGRLLERAKEVRACKRQGEYGRNKQHHEMLKAWHGLDIPKDLMVTLSNEIAEGIKGSDKRRVADEQEQRIEALRTAATWAATDRRPDVQAGAEVGNGSNVLQKKEIRASSR